MSSHPHRKVEVMAVRIRGDVCYTARGKRAESVRISFRFIRAIGAISRPPVALEEVHVNTKYAHRRRSPATTRAHPKRQADSRTNEGKKPVQGL